MKEIDLATVVPKRPQIIHGHWRLDVSSYELVCTAAGAYGYSVDLEECGDSAQVLDWIIHVSEKIWCKPNGP